MCPSSSSSSSSRGTNDNLKNDKNETSPRTSLPPRVAVIGCGPGGMFFLHAVSERRRQLEEAGDVQGLDALPQVTVMERNWGPGGVWCPSDPSNSGSTSTNMYEGLWINAFKELFEFHDHTFDQHFGGPMPAFLPRKHVLEYMMARITKHNPSILDAVEFGTCVDSVEWNEESKEFLVGTTKTRTDLASAASNLSKKMKRQNHTEEKKFDSVDSDDEDSTSENHNSELGEGERSISHFGSTEVLQRRTFDKVIWAAGSNGGPVMLPEDIMNRLKDQFSGKVIHSSQINQQLDISREDDPIHNKRILLIGDSYSAEDLALQFVKLGAAKVYISSRRGNGVAASTSTWPTNKNCEDGRSVEVLWYTSIVGGDPNHHKRIWFDRFRDGRKLNSTHVDDIDLIVLCTGYEFNLSMITDTSLLPWTECEEPSEMTERTWKLPKDWKMKTNPLTELLKVEIEPSDSIGEDYFAERLFRNAVLIQNPNMMFMYEDTDYPLLEIDLKAHMFLNFIMEPQKYLPSQTEMLLNNSRSFVDSFDYYAVRYETDPNYRAACKQIPSNTWYHNQLSRQCRALERETAIYDFLVLARDMAESNYPLQIGKCTSEICDDYDRKVPKLTNISDYELNETGNLMLDMSVASSYTRYEGYKFPKYERSWRTFRDAPVRSQSIYTGTAAVPLAGKWLELNDEGQVHSI
jgi:hypothetical protein